MNMINIAIFSLEQTPAFSRVVWAMLYIWVTDMDSFVIDLGYDFNMDSLLNQVSSYEQSVITLRNKAVLYR